MGRGEVHASRRVGEKDRIADDVICFHAESTLARCPRRTCRSSAAASRGSGSDDADPHQVDPISFRTGTAAGRRQRAEDQARARREELAHAQRVATLGELSASLAHEITQPLTAIAANVQAARRMLATPAAGDELKEALGDIAGDAERAGSIARRLRAMVRKQPGERQPIDINATVTGGTTILRRDLAQAEISLQLRLAEDLPRDLGDGCQLPAGHAQPA